MTGTPVLPSSPFRIEFEVTGVCNLNCVYCYAKPFNKIVPTLERIEYLFKKTKEEANPFEVVILGGEPFTRKDIVDVLEKAMAAFECNRVGVSTNGTILSKLTRDDIDRLRRIVDKGLSIQVTLDSIKPEINDITRGKTIETLEGLETLKNAKIPFTVGIVLTKINEWDVVNTVTWLGNNFPNLVHFNLEVLQPTFILGNRYDEFRLTSKKMREIYGAVKDTLITIGRQDIGVSGVIDNCDNIQKDVDPLIDSYGFKTCLAGLTRAGVCPNGTVTPCTTIRTVNLGNVYFESWTEIWEKAKERFLNLEFGGQCSINKSIRDENPSLIDAKDIPILIRKENQQKVKIAGL